jgi:DNA-binding CsgD family transcriptional regulator
MRVKIFLLDAETFTVDDARNFIERQTPHTQFEISAASATDDGPGAERLLVCVAYHRLAPDAVAALHTALARHAHAKLVVLRDAGELPSLGNLLDALVNAPTPRPVLPPSAHASAAADLRRLSEREHEILALLQEGLQNKVIARRLNLSVSTVKTHVANIFRKVGAGTRLDAICKIAALNRPLAADPLLPFRRHLAANRSAAMFNAHA